MDPEKNHRAQKPTKEELERYKKQRKIPKGRRLKTDRPKIKYGVIPEYILRDPSIPPGIKSLFGIVHSFATPKELERTPVAYEKVETYAECLGRSRTTVSEYLQWMHREGLLTIRRRYAGKTNVILLHAERKRR
jgi:hypothetical protein